MFEICSGPRSALLRCVLLAFSLATSLINTFSYIANESTNLLPIVCQQHPLFLRIHLGLIFHTLLQMKPVTLREIQGSPIYIQQPDSPTGQNILAMALDLGVETISLYLKTYSFSG